MYLRFSLTCLIFLIYFHGTISAKNNGHRPVIFPRRHHRRAAGPSEFLTPPPPGPQYHHKPQFPNGPIKHGKNLNPPSSPPTENPGYFFRLMKWLNPFGRDLPPQPALPMPKSNFHNAQSEYLQPPPPPPQNTYRPPLSVSQATQYHPSNQILPQPPLPPQGQSYSPPINKGKDCNPCNTAPWIPIHQETARNPIYANPPEASGSYDLGQHEGIEVQTSNFHQGPPAQEVKPPDFGYGVPTNLDHKVLIPSQNLNVPQAQFDSPFTGPIPNPHMYPGAIPPLYKAADFHPEENEQQALHSEISSQLIQTPTQQENSFTNPSDESLNHHFFPESELPHSSEGYVDALPSNTEISPDSDQLPTLGEFHDNRGSSSNSHQVLYPTLEHGILPETLNPTIDTLPINSQPFDTRLNEENSYSYETPNKQHIIHVEQSPVIDLSHSNSDESTFTNADAPVILQNSDGTFGINATFPNRNSTRIVWPEDQKNETSFAQLRPKYAQGSSIKLNKNSNRGDYNNDDDNDDDDIQAYEDNSDPLLGQGTSESRNISSILIQVFQNTNNQTRHQQELVLKNISTTINNTEQGILNDLMKSYDKFERNIIALKRPENSFDLKNNNSESEFGMSPRKENTDTFKGLDRNSKSASQQQGIKKNKQVQIIIPYTSQYTPGPFHLSVNQWNNTELDKNQDHKISTNESNYNKTNQGEIRKDKKLTKKDQDDFFYDIKALNNLSRGDILKTKALSLPNDSIIERKLQKNIDNWTIQEYSRGTTASIATPSVSHPHLTQSKQIPETYLTTTEPVSTVTIIQDPKSTLGNTLNGFNFNDLDHEVSSSNQVDVSHPQVLLSRASSQRSSAELDSISPTADMNGASGEDSSWEQLPVSISPLSNERVYVVTPQTTLKPTSFNSNLTDERTKVENESSNNNSTAQFESIERAYQVLPQAVNNLAVASTGPAEVPLWGIMEHDEYASSFNTSNKKLEKPILYTGHSKVSRTNQH
ncbi:uncharacterized protein [Chelonus insularis]|uniref:uncharacterized protein isoform X2 n=1 Tax=Chelonus insularis TaxID=460826 RepID=UPI0015889891|nr:uncharacterized protein LOC118074772 isoform X2 [Chelonus insularis]